MKPNSKKQALKYLEEVREHPEEHPEATKLLKDIYELANNHPSFNDPVYDGPIWIGGKKRLLELFEEWEKKNV